MRNLPCASPDPELQTPKGQGAGRELGFLEIQEEIRKYLRFLPQVAEPNLARVWEIKEEIERGTYLTRESVEETASRLALRFLQRE